jgi:phosphopantothenoylcysteine synthetase/decarboxylase
LITLTRTAKMKVKLLVGLTGSVASVKFVELITALDETSAFEIRVMLSDSAMKFISKDELAAIDQSSSIGETRRVYTDSDEWSSWSRVGDPVTHVDLAKWADWLLIAPLSANTLAKFANGLCDNLITCVFRAWNFDKRVFIAPAMNTQMWKSPFTARHVSAVRALAPNSVIVLDPIEKRLACGDTGIGAMEEVGDIVRALVTTVGVSS